MFASLWFGCEPPASTQFEVISKSKGALAPQLPVAVIVAQKDPVPSPSAATAQQPKPTGVLALKQPVQNKAAAKVKSKGQAETTAVEEAADALVKEQEILAVPEALVNWLTGGSRGAQQRRGAPRQTVMKTVQEGTGVDITIDPSRAVLGQKNLIIFGDKEQRNKAKSMMQDLRSRGSMDSLLGSVDDWGGLLSDPASVSPLFKDSSDTQRCFYRGRENVDLMSFDQMSLQTAFGGDGVSAPDFPQRENPNLSMKGAVEVHLSIADLRRNMKVSPEKAKKEADAQKEDVSSRAGPPKPGDTLFDAELTNQGNLKRQTLFDAELTKKFRECAEDLEKVQRHFNTQDSSEGIKQLMKIINQLSMLPASQGGIKALLGKKNGEESDSTIDFVCTYPDPGVRAAFASLIKRWKDFLAYTPDVAFDDTLNSFTQQSTHTVKIVGKPTLWREDKHGGAEISISKSSFAKFDNDEEERERVAAALRELAPLISGVQLVHPELIFFRMSDVDMFCEYMTANKIAEVRVRGPNNYVRLNIGTDAENNAFLAVVARLRKNPTLLKNSSRTLEDGGLKAFLGSAYL